MTREEELEIINKVRSGDVNAFEALVLEHQKKVYNLALRILGNESDAEDASQDAFIRAYNSLRSFRGDSKFSVWLYRLTSNICIDYLRSRSRRQTVSLTVDDDECEDGEEFSIPDERFSPDGCLDRNELRRAIGDGLQQLSPEYRRTLVLREINGLSYEEIGRALNIEEGTVKSRIFRARKKLCEFLVKEGNFPSAHASKFKEGGRGE